MAVRLALLRHYYSTQGLPHRVEYSNELVSTSPQHHSVRVVLLPQGLSLGQVSAVQLLNGGVTPGVVRVQHHLVDGLALSPKSIRDVDTSSVDGGEACGIHGLVGPRPVQVQGRGKDAVGVDGVGVGAKNVGGDEGLDIGRDDCSLAEGSGRSVVLMWRVSQGSKACLTAESRHYIP